MTFGYLGFTSKSGYYLHSGYTLSLNLQNVSSSFTTKKDNGWCFIVEWWWFRIENLSNNPANPACLCETSQCSVALIVEEDRLGQKHLLWGEWRVSPILVTTVRVLVHHHSALAIPSAYYYISLCTGGVTPSMPYPHMNF